MNIGEFFRNVASEMRKTSWPKRRELGKDTVVVITTVILMSVILGAYDLGISQLFRWFLSL